MSRKPDPKCSREELIRAALQDAVGLMIRQGRTAEEIRARRLEDTWQLLLEMDPSIDDDMGAAADAAMAVPRIRPTEPDSDKSPYLQVLNQILSVKRGTSEATALAYFLVALAEDSPFTASVQGCREQCCPQSQRLLASALDHYLVNGIDAELREVVAILGTRYDLPRSPRKDDPASEDPEPGI